MPMIKKQNDPERLDKNNVILERFQELIRDSGKTRQVIAQEIGCDTSTVTKQFNGDMKISVDYLVKYARYFHVSTDYLLGMEKDELSDHEKPSFNYLVESEGRNMLKVPDGDKYKIFGLCYSSKIAAEGTARTFGDFNPFTYQELGAARAYHRVIEILGLEDEYKAFEQVVAEQEEARKNWRPNHREDNPNPDYIPPMGRKE